MKRVQWESNHRNDRTVEPTPDLDEHASYGVAMVTHIARTKIIYEVFVGSDIFNADEGGCHEVWSRTVVFGSGSNKAGGLAFKLTAREQERVAHEWAQRGQKAEIAR